MAQLQLGLVNRDRKRRKFMGRGASRAQLQLGLVNRDRKRYIFMLQAKDSLLNDGRRQCPIFFVDPSDYQSTVES